jgi:Ca2+-binding RTX toxin-like protein
MSEAESLERIVIRYKPLDANLPGGGAIFHHKYIVYIDKNGNEFAMRGGPTENTAAYSYEQKIHVDVGPLVSGFPDFPEPGDFGYPAPQFEETIIEAPELADVASALASRMLAKSDRYYYIPFTNNSNSIVDQSLAESNLPSPQHDSIFSGHWAPASGQQLLDPAVFEARELQNAQILLELAALNDGIPLFPRPPDLEQLLHRFATADSDNNGVIDSLEDTDHDSIPDGIDATPFGDDNLLPSERFLGRILDLDIALPLPEDAPAFVSPIVLDLDGDGVETTAVAGATHFDHDGDRLHERTGFAAADDGLLALDRNGDGAITEGAELFGTRTHLSDGTLAANGFQALAELDGNGDGQITSLDAAFQQLRVFKDQNENGRSDAGELLTLEQAGVSALSLNFTESGAFIDPNGNHHQQRGSYTTMTGQTRDMNDVYFKTDRIHVQESAFTAPSWLAALPNTLPIATIHSIHYQISVNGDLALAGDLLGFLSSRDVGERRSLVESMIFRLTGQSETPDIIQTVSNVFDARRLRAMERIWDQPTPVLGQPNFSFAYNQLFDGVVDSLYAQLSIQSNLRDLFSRIDFVYDDQQGAFRADMRDAALFIIATVTTSPGDGWSLLSDFLVALHGLDPMFSVATDDFVQQFHPLAEASGILSSIPEWGIDDTLLQGAGGAAGAALLRAIGWADAAVGTSLDNNFPPDHSYAEPTALYGFGGNDQLLGSSFADLLSGGSGSDTIQGQSGDDRLSGGADNDSLLAGDGADTLRGDAGDDVLVGEAGNDVYLFDRGDGHDEIYDGPGSLDRIVFGQSIEPGNLQVSRDQYNLYVFIDQENSITIINYFADLSSIEEITFQDGTVWSQSYLAANSPYRGTGTADHISGTSDDEHFEGFGGPDTIESFAGDDTLIGGDGNDSLLAGVGNDTLSGGAGADALEGGEGDDYYLFARGDGQDEIFDTAGTDRITFAQNITADDISLRRDGDALVLSIPGTTDQLRVVNYFIDSSATIEVIEFSDGTLWDRFYVLEHALIVGTDVHDVLIGSDESDQISGLAGDDSLHGLDGADLLQGGAGNDYLAGGEGSDTLAGDSGDDVLEGGGGGDTYRFGRGDGRDQILESAGIDRVLFGADVTPDDVSLERFGNALEIQILATNDRLIVSDYFGDSQFQVESLEFANGTIFDATYVLSHVSIVGGDTNDQLDGTSGSDRILGAGGNDTVSGYAGDDAISGGTGDDFLAGGDGNDTLAGEQGDDYLDGGSGADTYLFARGDGQDQLLETGGTDRILLAEDVMPGEILLGRSGDSLEIVIASSGDRLVVNDYFGDSSFLVESIEFSDGTIWNKTYVTANVAIFGTDTADSMIGSSAADRLYGYAGNDTVLAGAGNDALYGGSGNDVLAGEGGNDTLAGEAGNDDLQGGTGADAYLFSRGGGQDEIYEEGGTDKIVLGSDIAPGDIILGRVLDSLDLMIAGTTDRIRVSGYFSGSVSVVDTIEFSNGTVWDQTYVTANVSIFGTEGADSLSGSGSADRIYGYGGNDTIAAAGGADVLFGGAGNDTLRGEAGNDTLSGGAGNDALEGGTNSDTYLFDRGDGQDTIVETSGTDRLLFGLSVSPADVVLERRTDGALDIRIAGTSDRISVLAHFSNSIYLLEQIAFADGTIWDQTFIQAHATYVGTVNADSILGSSGADAIVGYEGNDTLSGSGGSDTLDGGAGADSLLGGDDDDQLTGGAGNDALQGQAGGDTYRFSSGDGQDTITEVASASADRIVLGSGIASANILLERVGSDLYVRIRNTSDWLRVISYFSAAANVVEQIELADGTVWDEAYIRANASFQGTSAANSLSGSADPDLIYGFQGADTLSGLGGDDRLVGGLGNDSLRGGSGNDQYLFARGDGQDTIDEANGNASGSASDRIVLAADITSAQATLEKIGSDLYLKVSGTTDQIKILGHFSSTAAMVERINFADGTSWSLGSSTMTLGTSAANTLTGTASGDFLYGFDGNDSLSGLDGADVLVGGNGNDTLSGGAGNDTLQGGAGDDTLQGGSGSDHFLFAKGTGADTLVNENGTVDTDDTVLMGSGIAADQVWLERTGNDLRLMLIETGDTMTVQSWYSDASARVDGFVLSDGRRLVEGQVETLVSAMAAFAPPLPGSASLPQSYQDVLATTIAQSWT